MVARMRGVAEGEDWIRPGEREDPDVRRERCERQRDERRHERADDERFAAIPIGKGAPERGMADRQVRKRTVMAPTQKATAASSMPSRGSYSGVKAFTWP